MMGRGVFCYIFFLPIWQYDKGAMTAMYYQDILCSLDSIKQKYQLVDGIFRNNGIYSASQGQTSDTFAFKWAKRATYESDVVHQKRNSGSLTDT